MSIQQSINQGILSTAALVSQNPEFQEKKKESAYEKKLEGTIDKLKNTQIKRVESIVEGTDKAVKSGDEHLLYNQLKRFKQFPESNKQFFELADYKFSEAKKHYIEKGDLEKYSKYKGYLESLPGRKEKLEDNYREDYKKLKREYWKAKYGNEYLGQIETNKELDRAEQIQANTNNFHKMLKNKSKVDVVGERNGK